MDRDEWTLDQQTVRAMLENMPMADAMAVVQDWIEDNGVDPEDLE